MKQCIKNWKTGETIYNGEHKTMRDAVEHCVKNNICLNYASLNGASLHGASLNGASLHGASLDGASLNGASLNEVLLNWASLDGASLNRASLNGASLKWASLNEVSLKWASLNEASLNGASLNEASLDGASLKGASLKGASLNEASLKGASLDGASLDGASLNEALLNGASLDGASYNHLTIGITMACPATGSYECWKKCDDEVLVKLLVPAEAKRSSATTRKCRSEFVYVLDGEGKTEYNGHITYYKKGEIVRSFNGFDENRWNECSTGIHHFVNKEDAERWDY
jgi:hypothetical protein